MEAQFAAMTLGNMLEGEVERQVQAALTELSAVLEEAEEYERGKDDTLRCGFTIEVELERQGMESMLNITARTRTKRPKRKRIGRTIFYKAGAFTVPTFTQAELFPRRPIALRATEEE